MLVVPTNENGKKIKDNEELRKEGVRENLQKTSW